ncbi:excalibur calcium-binding domain-containing protein [Janibacter melonis]|uniref:excalibur calcium-binding domain-containing protein n=1 Tax=Janibacter melonis TaxID=262209 RepID=UPI001E2C177F|nr:excalibur calcium-binding domain-containing protein [Janibacter melonis]MCB5990471.1 excalibur calcium-binding domain-containing protein [Janibacter melonis]MCM3554868.1 excalibur calcium-binding domain-containing protein [Janibacter melonis]
MRRTLATLTASLVCLTPAAVALAAPAPTTASAGVKVYKNCTELNKTYKHGVGKAGARDKTKSGTKPVTNFRVNTKVYNANKKHDRDKDGVACEKR